MSAASLFESVAAWLARAAPPSLVEGTHDQHRDGSISRVDTFGNPVDDSRVAERGQREIEDRAREHQILISCWM